MSLVAEAAYYAFGAEKMNYELLGNGDTHLHWYLLMYAETNRPTPEKLQEMKTALKKLNKRIRV